MFVSAMEATIVATAMPSIVGSLGGMELYSWVFSGFLLMQVLVIPLLACWFIREAAPASASILDRV